MKTSTLFLVVSAVLGLLSGLLLGGAGAEDSELSPDEDLSASQTNQHREPSRRTHSSSSNSRPQSSDTLESIKSAPSDELYSRLALWLMTADETDIAAYWDHFLTVEERPRQIFDLIMIGWTRVNPEGAIAATKGTEHEHYAWWAWACHDPDRALEVVMETDPSNAGNVSWGLGEFHPKWVRENWDMIPSSQRSNSLAGISKWAPTDDPMATAEFQIKNGMVPSVGALRYLVRQDPEAAYSWFEKNAKSLGSRYGQSDSAFRSIGAALAKDAPEVLEKVIAESSTATSRFHLESAAFEQSLKDDPDAALASAQANSNPEFAAHFMSQAGLKLVNSDPERAFQVAAKILETSDKAFAPLVLEKDGKNTYLGNNQARNFVSALAQHDPKRTVEEIIAPLDWEQGRRIAGEVSVAWASQDPEGMQEWLKNNEPPTAQILSSTLVESYLQTQRFEEALNFVNGYAKKHGANLQSTYQRWLAHNPAEAKQWLDSSDFSAEEKQALETPPASIQLTPSR